MDMLPNSRSIAPDSTKSSVVPHSISRSCVISHKRSDMAKA